MGLSEARARASVRFSLSRLTTADEVDAALQIVPAAVARLRELAPKARRASSQLTTNN
jgi:cysteine desulfurase